VTTTQQFFPRARISMGGGDLFDVVNFTLGIDAIVKIIHTLRQNGAGAFKGPVEGNINFDSVVGSLGMEADWPKLVAKPIYSQMRVKLPGLRTIALDGMFEKFETKGSTDAETTVSMSFKGTADI